MASKTKKVKILVQNGKIITLYSDEIAQALQKGLKATAEVKRISHVEPVPGEQKNIQFTADLSPVGGPLLTGFSSYEEAVTAEVNWIEKNHLTNKKPIKRPTSQK